MSQNGRKKSSHSKPKDFLLRLRPVGDEKYTILALRQLLKRLLRQGRLKCLRIEGVSSESVVKVLSFNEAGRTCERK